MKFLNVKPCGSYSYHCALNGYALHTMVTLAVRKNSIFLYLNACVHTQAPLTSKEGSNDSRYISEESFTQNQTRPSPNIRWWSSWICLIQDELRWRVRCEYSTSSCERRTDSALGWGTAWQEGKSWVRIPVGSWKFSSGLILLSAFIMGSNPQLVFKKFEVHIY